MTIAERRVYYIIYRYGYDLHIITEPVMLVYSLNWPILVCLLCIPFVTYAILWRTNTKVVVPRCILELVTGLVLSLFAYDSAFYVIVFIVISGLDIVPTGRDCAYSLIFIYLHNCVFLLRGDIPLLALLPFLLSLCRITHVYEWKRTNSQELYRNISTPLYVHAPLLLNKRQTLIRKIAHPFF